MLKPDYFNNKADTLISYYQELEDWLLKDIAERLLKNDKLSATADRNLFMLQQMGVQNKEIQERLQSLTKLSNDELQYLLQEAVVASWKADSAVFEEIGTNIQSPLENARVRQIMNAEYMKTRGELNNLTRTTMNQANMDLINLMNEADIRLAGGMQSYSSVICDILDHYAKAGLMVGYPAGTQRSLEAAVRCAVVTSMNQTTAQVTNGYIAEEGIEYVLVSAHYGARHDEKHPEGLQSHDWWQGKAFKIRGSEEGFPNLLESTGYDIEPITGRGTVVNPLGLHGYNCRHSHQPWDKDLDNPWINPDGTPRIDPEKSREQYERQQAQRSMERTIRADKRQLNMKQLEMDLLPEDSIELASAKADYERLAYKYSQHNKEYNLYCERHGLTKQSDRLKIAGFHRAEAAKAGGAAKKFKSELVSFSNTGQQYYKKLDLLESKSEFKRGMEFIEASKLKNYNAYLSKNAKVKPKEMHIIDYGIRRAQSILKIENESWKPNIVIASDTEMKKNVIASYKAQTNTMFINSKMANMSEEDITFYMVHEFIHWKDAAKYKNINKRIDSNYLDNNIEYCKKKVEKLQKRGYNIDVTTYAKMMRTQGRFDEVYTEIRTVDIMRELSK